MIVMSATQPKSLASRTVTSVLEVKPVQIGETSEDVSRIAEQIRAGQAFLEVVVYPWGVEFEVYRREERE
jgi:hypothetical protein